MEKTTVAILAGGSAKRFGSEKALAEFQGRPLIAHMVDVAQKLSSEIMIVVSDETQEENLRGIVSDVRIVVDPPSEIKSALAGALTAFEYTLTSHVLLLPIDTPLANTELLKMLIRMSPGHGAVVPAWPSGYIEPLHSVYLAEHAYFHGLKVMAEGLHRMRALLDRLHSVLFVSTETLKQFDSDLNTFTNINTPKELRAAERKSPRK
ncbi:MAG: molybdenum cofactor guanylyltransferase [Candidatus Thorarchaeota archaeon]|nr:MAG: molybdenum cofactor guanylyltransferase [Candidatus Thorarchaeota archaeon]